MYRLLTTDNNVFQYVTDSSITDPDWIMKKIDKELTSIKFRAFGKVKVKKRNTDEDDSLEELLKEKEYFVKRKTKDNQKENEIDEVDLKISKALQVKQNVKLNNEFGRLSTKMKSKGKAAVVFDMKDSIFGGKKTSDEPSMIIDPKSKKPVFKPSEIVEISADYCQNLLKNKNPKEEFEDDLYWKHQVHKVRMEETIDTDMSFSREMFDETLDSLRKKTGNKYEFIIKAGQSLKDAIYKLFEVV